MRGILLISAALSALAAGSARAGDKVLTGPVPTWVLSAPALKASDLPRTGNVIPLFDEQVQVDGDTTTVFIDSATLISSPEVLAARGTIGTRWQPEHGDVTFHRIEILRGDQTIDVLQAGAGFTVLRREAALERQIVDGQLTAVKHIEGLRVGDILRVSLSVAQRDPVLAGNVQDGLLLIPAPAQIKFGRARLLWQTGRPLAWKALMPGVTATTKAVDTQWNELVVTLPVPKLPEMPKNMPARFQQLPIVQFSSFKNWGAVTKLMAPLYVTKGTIAPGSELAKRIDAIAARSGDPVHRMADALQMVQDEVRYQLVALGAGNYVPQTPAETWSKRYGDCKAKTLLLLAILDRLGIEGEPVLANIKRGDGVSQMLPSAAAFDHIFVRARVAGEDYWLDGTMLGNRLADIRNVPAFGQVLPVFTQDGTLVDLPRRAHSRPDLDVKITYDMASGPHLPAPFHLTLRYAGSFAAEYKVEEGPDFADKLTSFAEKAAGSWVGSQLIGKPTAQYDPELAIWTLSMDGVAYLDWKYRDNRYGLSLGPTLKVVHDAPRDRASWRAIPALIERPWSANSTVEYVLPATGKDVTVSGEQNYGLTLPAVDWQRSIAFSGNKLIEQIVSRESGAEITPDKLSATGKAISDAMVKTARIELAPAYPHRWTDVAKMRGTAAVAKARALFDERVAAKPEDATRVADRAWFKKRLLDFASSEVDYSKAISVDGTAARYLDRSVLRSEVGNHDGALKDAQTAYTLEEGNNDVRYQLALELAQAGKPDEALELLPANFDASTDEGLGNLLGRAYVMELGDRHNDALALLDSAIETRGSAAQLRNARCWYQGLHNSNLETALSDCNRAMELESDPADFFDSRAMVHFRAGRLKDATADYEAALAVAPDQASSLFMSGVVLARLGDKAKSAAALQAARTLLPSVDQFYARFGIKP